MISLSGQEIAYLREHRIGRLATAGVSGTPHVVPVGYHFDAERGTIKIGANVLQDRGQERLYVRHLRANPQAAFVVDDLQVEPSWTPSGILLKGTARLHAEGGEGLGPGFGPNWVEIVPTWVSSWGVDTDTAHLPVPREASVRSGPAAHRSGAVGHNAHQPYGWFRSDVGTRIGLGAARRGLLVETWSGGGSKRSGVPSALGGGLVGEVPGGRRVFQVGIAVFTVRVSGRRSVGCGGVGFGGQSGWSGCHYR